jgi:hypothetical protein
MQLVKNFIKQKTYKMKNRILFIMVCVLVATSSYAQKWHELNDEEKLMKLKSFRAENQKYLKDSLHMSETQLNDIDNVNICFLSTLDRIDRYAKEDATKEKYAQALWDVRWAQLDAIMGKGKHDKYAAYMEAKLQKAAATTK